MTLDGRPLPAARISFHPDSTGPVAYGLSLDDGSYWLKTGARQSGLAPGDYRVTVFAMKVTDGDEQAAGPLLTPAIYADPRKTPLRCRVEAGRNEIPLNLETTATPARPQRVRPLRSWQVRRRSLRPLLDELANRHPVEQDVGEHGPAVEQAHLGDGLLAVTASLRDELVGTRREPLVQVEAVEGPLE